MMRGWKRTLRFEMQICRKEILVVVAAFWMPALGGQGEAISILNHKK